MNRILQLTQDKTAALDSAKAILSKMELEKRSEMTTEERAAFDQHKATAAGIAATITAEEEMAALTNIHNDGAERRGRTGAKDGVSGHDNWTDNPYLFGRAPVVGETKVDREARIRLGFGEQLAAVKQAALIQVSAAGGQVDKRLYELQSRAAAAGASEAVPADGGFLIQPDFSSEVLTISHDTGLVYTRARKLPLSETTNSIKVPAVDEQSRVDGSRWGGVRMFWENEADALTGSKPKFRLLELTTKKLTGLYYATNEVLQDARALGALAMQGFGEEMAFKMDDAVIEGNGAGQPMGVMNSPCLVTVAKETGQAAGTIVYENIKKMWGRMWGRSRLNSAWFINQDTEQQLNGMSQVVGTAGAPVYLPPGGASAQPYAMLYGRPVIPIEQCSTLGTAGDIILADFSQYLYVDKGDLQSAVSMHVRFLTDEQTFRWIYRTDGQPIWATALTPFKGSNTLSPFVALAAR